MKKIHLKSQQPIPNRANAKLVTVNSRHFIIGGLTADTITNDIIQFRVNIQAQQPQVQYKKMQSDNIIFTPRNSFAVCSTHNQIFIWGGLQLHAHQQTCLSDLIEFNVQKHTFQKYPVKNPFPIHSAVVTYQHLSNKLIAYGGTDEKGEFQCFLYCLDLTISNSEWVKTRIECKQHQGLVWQHSGHISQKSIVNKQLEGIFLIIVGGCREPHSPYPYIIQIDINKKQVSGSIKLDVGLVSQDTILSTDGSLYIFGGSIGGDFNKSVYKVYDGKYEKIDSHNAIGCGCLQIKQGFVVYGGVSGMQSLNDMFLYVPQGKK